MNAMIWLILFVVLVVFEIATMGLTTIWFAAGALIAFFASLLHATWWLQFVFFIVVSLIMLIFTRPFALRYVNRHTTKTNIDSVIGQGVLLHRLIMRRLLAMSQSMVLNGLQGRRTEVSWKLTLWLL